MRIAVGSDERPPLTSAVVALLAARGHETALSGPLAGVPGERAEVALAVAQQVAAGNTDRGNAAGHRPLDGAG